MYLSSWKWLLNMGPGYAVPGSAVKVLANPEAFYSVLLEKAKSARQRVSLASLYIGTGHLEKQFVSSKRYAEKLDFPRKVTSNIFVNLDFCQIGELQKNLEGNSKLEVKVLLDFARGSRGLESSRTVLMPLLRTSDSCHVSIIIFCKLCVVRMMFMFCMKFRCFCITRQLCEGS